MDVAIAQNLTPRVEAALKQILAGTETDEFDAPEFDSIDYVNKHFPDEKSLSKLDAAIDALDEEVKDLDESILETVRVQSTSGREAARDIAEAKDSIGDLHFKIIEIKKKADASEQMVQDICKDIRQLDIAKKHLTHTIEALNGLRKLTSFVDDLKRHSGSRNYELAAPSLKASVTLLRLLAEYRDVRKVSDLYQSVERVRSELREHVNEDFDVLLETVTPATMAWDEGAASGGTIRIQKLEQAELAGLGPAGDSLDSVRLLSDSNIATLQAIGGVIDALGPGDRKAILKSYCRRQLGPYTRIFRRSGAGDIGDTLAGIEKRFKWFQKALGDVDAHHGRAFMYHQHWRVLHRLALDFCEQTRADVEKILSQYEPPSAAPPEQLLAALVATQKFEKAMAKRFDSDLPASLRAGSSLSASSASASAGGGGAASAMTGGGGAAGGSGAPRFIPIGGAGSSSSAFAGGAAAGEEEKEEEYDPNAPLYNAQGQLVDRFTSEGVKLNNARKKLWEERREAEKKRRKEAEDQRAWLARLGGRDAAAARARLDEDDTDGINEEISTWPRFFEAGKGGIISAAFEPNMGAYIRFEKENIGKKVGVALLEDFSQSAAAGGAGADGSSTSMFNFLSSSRLLFTECRSALSRAREVGTPTTVLGVFKEVASAFREFCEQLEGRIPKPVAQPPATATFTPIPGDVYEVTDATAAVVIEQLCLIINTADYVTETLPTFSEVMQNLVQDEAAKTLISTSVEGATEAFLEMQGSALKALSGVVASVMDAPLAVLTRTPWEKTEQVGDSSPYVAEIGALLKTFFPKIRGKLNEAPFRNFCDKFAKAFVTRYTQAVFRCKRINEPGAQQLQLDLQVLKKILLEAPAYKDESTEHAPRSDEDGLFTASIEAAEKINVPTIYVKHIQRELPRVEMLFKIIATPLRLLPESIQNLWREANQKDVLKIAELRGLNAKEKNDLLVALGFAAAGPRIPAVGTVTGAGVTSMTTGVLEGGAKFMSNITNVGKLFTAAAPVAKTGIAGGAAAKK